MYSRGDIIKRLDQGPSITDNKKMMLMQKHEINIKRLI
jgi:hypothetical protein